MTPRATTSARRTLRQSLRSLVGAALILGTLAAPAFAATMDPPPIARHARRSRSGDEPRRGRADRVGGPPDAPIDRRGCGDGRRRPGRERARVPAGVRARQRLISANAQQVHLSAQSVGRSEQLRRTAEAQAAAEESPIAMSASDAHLLLANPAIERSSPVFQSA